MASNPTSRQQSTPTAGGGTHTGASGGSTRTTDSTGQNSFDDPSAESNTSSSAATTADSGSTSIGFAPTTATAPTITSGTQETPPTSALATSFSQHSTSAASGALAGSPTSTPSISSTDEGYSAGSLAGGIVGAAIAGAIIAFLATFFLCKRRSRRQAEARRSHDVDGSQWTTYKGGVAVAEKPASRSGDDVLDWQAYLPQSADDRTMQNAVKTLFDQIELHVDNYYTRIAVEPDESVRADLARMETSKLPGQVATLISDPLIVQSVIKHCIANQLVSNITPSENASQSLLPSRLAQAHSQLQSSSTPAREHKGLHRCVLRTVVSPKLTRVVIPAMQQAYRQWRLLDSYLFPRTQQDSSDTRRLQSVSNDIFDSIYLAFMPWQADNKNDEALQQHQRSLIARASDLGTLILSQPSTYTFDWVDRSDDGQMVVLPGFLKTTNEQGLSLDDPQSLVPPKTVRL